jgi:hypothetical protein
MKHATARGKIVYTSTQDGVSKEFGREWFSVTAHEDGQRTLRALCEIEAGVVAPRDVVREVTYTTDAQFRPVDCFNRLHANGRFLGSGWIRFDGLVAECESFSATHGRVSQRIALERPATSLGSHPVSCDMLHLARFDHSRRERIQHQPDVWMTSIEHDGCSGPMLQTIALDLEYCGRETITVPAGTFETDHYRFLLEGTLPREHPTEDLWCLPDTYFFVKITVGGYMAASFDLVEYEPFR